MLLSKPLSKPLSKLLRPVKLPSSIAWASCRASSTSVTSSTSSNTPEVLPLISPHSIYVWGSSSNSRLPTVPSSSTLLSPRKIPISAVNEDLGLDDSWSLKHFRVGKGDNTGFVFAKNSGTEDEINRTFIYGDDKYNPSREITEYPPSPTSDPSKTSSITSDFLVDDLVLGPKSFGLIARSKADSSQSALSWGYGGDALNGYGQLGLGPSVQTDGQYNVTLPSPITSLTEDFTPLTQWQIASSHTVGLSSSSNEVLTAGSGQFGRLGNIDAIDQLYFEPVEMLSTLPSISWTQVSAGHAFTLALASDGTVHGWGKNEANQLGLGGGLSMDVYNMENAPNSIEFFEINDIHVAQVACGYNHAAALDVEGNVYVWGGKSGFLSPELVTNMEEKATWVGCGHNFTVVAAESNALYTFSHGGSSGGVKLGCLGHGSASGDRTPREVVSLDESLIEGKVVDVQVGWTGVGVVVGEEE
ncbi:hypothetical protein TrVE_jg3138 [Triparma verrucosa]|uniref:RCC1/BLIP-II protein n=1 Tax=Triparma verrucosa TaxID=1606542 RepID=A0A9W7BIK7_9STRA|nr:hypothetical protein TrVE_jg3138 [Triparma verrucosa]